MKLQKLELILENCDVITIEGKYVGNIIVDDIRTSIKRLACNSIDKIEKCYEFMVEIHKGANKERYQFGQTQIEEFKESTFDGITRYADVTHIELYFIDEESGKIEHYNYSVNWTGSSECENDSQKSYISNLGHLYLTITENKSIEDYYDIEQLNSKSYMDFHMNACLLGK